MTRKREYKTKKLFLPNNRIDIIRSLSDFEDGRIANSRNWIDSVREKKW